MEVWAGIALATRTPGDDAMGSRIPTYLHPLAGRSLAWHVIRALAALRPRARQILLVWAGPADLAVVGELPARLVTVEPGTEWWPAVAERLDASVERLLLVDASAVALSVSLNRVMAGTHARVLKSENGAPLALWTGAASAAELAGDGSSLAHLAGGARNVVPTPGEGFLVEDRAGLARAAAVVRDRVVQRIMAGGVTVLLPETVLADVDVVVGPDSVIYPGVIMEGQTRIGTEAVIGPGCRIVDSRIGNGVELKGWNYVVGTNIRNRAVLEPYVRRGFD